MEKAYNRTISACFVGYVVQAIVNNFAPLLFLTFHGTYNIPLSQITLLVTFNFGIQLLVDLLAVRFADRIGYRVSIVAAHVFSALGLVLLAILPKLLPSPFLGILISVMIYAVGGGLLEVLVSPIVEACPTGNKEKAMSMLHSFYCWGHVGVVLVSTLFFRVFGTENWNVLALLWAVVPVVNAVVLLNVPIAPLLADGECGMGTKALLKSRLFWLLAVMMVCAGASEQSVSQWASTLMETGFGISKTVGDLIGPMLFAVCMGTSRAFYGKFGENINLNRFMVGSSILAIAAYLGVALLPIPQLGLVCCALCGLSVGIMWPGTFSKAAAMLKGGGTAMFALLALGGDLGCAVGPTVVGFVSALCGDDLKWGILAAVIFPTVLLLGIFRSQKQ